MYIKTIGVVEELVEDGEVDICLTELTTREDEDGI